MNIKKTNKHKIFIRLLSLVIILTVIFGMVACGENKENTNNSMNADTSTDTNTDTVASTIPATFTGETIWVCSSCISYTEESTTPKKEEYIYEVLGDQLVIKTILDGIVKKEDTYIFDENGKLLDDGIYTYVYNGAGILQKRLYKDNGNINETYDSAGNLTEVFDYDGSLMYLNEYDGDGNLLKKKEFDYNGDLTFSSEYDKNGNLLVEESFSNGASERRVFTYDSNENRTRMDYYGKASSGHETTSYKLYEYNDKNLLTKEVTYQDNSGVMTYTYQYDEFGNITLKQSQYNYNGQNSMENKWTYTYNYDENGNILECVSSMNDDAPTIETYSYYPNGNKKTKSRTWRDTYNYLWDEEGNLLEESKYTDDKLQYRSVYTYKQIQVAPEMVMWINTNQPEL